MKKPFVSLEQIQEIKKTYPTPFYIYDEKGIRENARAVNRAFSWNKGFREYFAVKATPTPGILQILKEEGCGADCSSYTELQIAEAVGVTGHQIMFSSNVTPAEDFALAAKLGAIINFDDANAVTHALTKKGFSSTKLATTGGFLMAGNVTILVGVDEEKVQTVIDIIKEHSHSRKQMIPTTTEMSYGYYPSMPVEVTVGGATIFVVDIERFERA